MDWKLLLVIGLAGILRLSALGLVEFKADEALTVASLRQFVSQPYFPQAGLVSSTGARNFPLFTYLLIPFSLISTDPRFLSGVIGLINVLLLGWFYHLTKREFGSKIALISSLILATAPFCVLYSRKIWAQDLIFLFAIPIYGLVLRAIDRSLTPKELACLFGLLMLQAQLHASGIFFGLVVGLFVLIRQPKIVLPPLLGLLIGLLPAIPYFWLQITARPQFPDLVAARQLASVSPYQLDWRHTWLPLTFFTSFGWSEVMGPGDWTQFTAQSPAVGLNWLTSIIVIIALIYAGFIHRSTFLIWGVLILFFIFGVPGRLHYYQVLAPYLALLAGIGLKTLCHRQPALLAPTLGLVVIGNLLFIIMFCRYLITYQQLAGDYGVPYQYSNRSIEDLIQPYR